MYNLIKRGRCVFFNANIISLVEQINIREKQKLKSKNVIYFN